jgi:hypothetical protein
MVRITISGVIDPDGDAVDVSATNVFQDEPVNAPGDGSGNTSPDAFLEPLSVRAERSGGGDGRVYTLSLLPTTDAAADASAMCSCAFLMIKVAERTASTAAAIRFGHALNGPGSLPSRALKLLASPGSGN